MVSTYKAVFDNIVMGEYTLDLLTRQYWENSHEGIFSWSYNKRVPDGVHLQSKHSQDQDSFSFFENCFHK